MVNFGPTSDLGALVAELQAAMDSGELTPGDQSAYQSLLGAVMVLRDARRHGVPDDLAIRVLRTLITAIEEE